MVSTERKRRSTCGRGVLKFKAWKPLPRPGELNKDENKETVRQSAATVTNVAKKVQSQTSSKGIYFEKLQ